MWVPQGDRGALEVTWVPSGDAGAPWVPQKGYRCPGRDVGAPVGCGCPGGGHRFPEGTWVPRGNAGAPGGTRYLLHLRQEAVDEVPGVLRVQRPPVPPHPLAHELGQPQAVGADAPARPRHEAHDVGEDEEELGASRG